MKPSANVRKFAVFDENDERLRSYQLKSGIGITKKYFNQFTYTIGKISRVFPTSFKIIFIGCTLFPAWKSKISDFFPHETSTLQRSYSTTFMNSVGNLIFRSSNLLVLVMKKFSQSSNQFQSK